jgi:hypothetical protein
MKLVFILSGNTYRSHLGYYFKFCQDNKIEYDIICWNRKSLDEKNVLAFNLKQSEDKGYIYRFVSYLRYRKFIVDIMMRNKYDKVIVSTIAIGVLLYPYLAKNYKKNYIFDIRDYSVVTRFVSGFFRKLIEKSAATVISSSGYIAWLPKNWNYLNSHNFPFDATNGNITALNNTPVLSRKIKNIHISSIGSLRDFEANTLLIQAFKERKDFYLNFIGSGPAYANLKLFVDRMSISNVYFHGPYTKSEEVGLLAGTTIINNFTNDDLNSKTLTTNRFYLSVVLAIPMIVREGTHQADLCKKYNLGCVIKPALPIPEQILEYIESFDYEQYSQGRYLFLELVKQDTELLNNVLMNFVGKDVDG